MEESHSWQLLISYVIFAEIVSQSVKNESHRLPLSLHGSCWAPKSLLYFPEGSGGQELLLLKVGKNVLLFTELARLQILLFLEMRKLRNGGIYRVCCRPFQIPSLCNSVCRLCHWMKCGKCQARSDSKITGRENNLCSLRIRDHSKFQKCI